MAGPGFQNWRASGEYDLSKFGAFDTGYGGEPREKRFIFLSGRRALKVECVGDDTAHEDAGYLGGGGHVVSTEEVGDDSAGGAYGVVYEEDGVLGGRVAEAVVVDDFEYVDF